MPWLNLTGRTAVNTSWRTRKNWRAATLYDFDIKPTGSNISSFVEDEEDQIVGICLRFVADF